MEFNLEKIKQNNERKILWEKYSNNVEYITDGLGKTIDNGIKESVVAFNVMGFNTSGSCEGHLQSGLPYPWIDVEGLDANFLRDYSEIKEVEKIIKEKRYADINLFAKDYPVLYKKRLKIQNLIEQKIKDTDFKLNLLINEFYTQHKPLSYDSKIIIQRGPGSFRLEPIAGKGTGLDNWKKFDEKINKMSLEEKKLFLENNQAEMKAFTEFLKRKFFEDNSINKK